MKEVNLEDMTVLLDAMPDAVLVLNPKGEIVFANAGFLDLFALKPDMIVGNHFTEMNEGMHPEDMERAADAFEGLMLRGETIPFETKAETVDGRKLTLSATFSLFRDTDDNINFLIATIRDITEQIRDRGALKASEEKWHSLTENSPDYIMTLDLEGNITYINHTLPELSKEEVIGTSFYRYALPEYEEITRQCFEDVLRTRDPGSFESVYENPDGRKQYFETNVSLSVKDDEVVGLTVISRDITERKKAENITIQQQKIMKAINTVFIKALTCEREEDLARTCLEVAQELVGAEFGFFGEVNMEAKFDTLAISNPGWDECKMPESQAIRMIKGMVIRGMQFLPLKDGKSRIFNDPSNHPDSVGTPEGHPEITCLLAVPLRYGGKVIGQIGLGNKEGGYNLQDQEATEALSVAMVEALMRKKAEEALRESEAKFKTLAEESPNMIFINKRGKIVYVNESCTKVMGYTYEEFYSPEFDFYELIVPESREIAKSNLRLHLSGKDVGPYEYSLITKASKRIETIVSTKLVTYEGKNAILGIITDITEQKEAEEEIKIERDKLQALMDGLDRTQIGIDIIGSDFRIQMQNQTLKDRFGDLTGKLCHENYMGLNQPCDPCPYAIAIKSNNIESIEMKGVDGKDYRVITAPLQNPEGTIDKGIEVIIDITERKRAEEVLRESEEKYKTLVEKSLEGVWQIDNTGITIFSSPRMGEILGYSSEEMIGKNFMDFMDEDARKEARMLFDRRKKGISEVHEFRFKHKSGRYIYTMLSTVPYMDEGEFKGGIAYVSDITEQKHAEEALKVSEERYRALFEQAADSIILADAETGELVEFNEMTHKNLGYTREEFVGIKIQDFEVNETATEVRKHLKKVIEKGVDTFESKHRTKGGEIRDVLVTSKALSIHGSNFVQSMWRDITDRKKAEEAYKTVVDKSLQGFAISQDERYVFMNQTYADIFGYKINEMLELSPEDIRKLLYPQDRDEVIQRHKDRKVGKAVSPKYELRIKRKDGKVRWLEAIVSPIDYQGRNALQLAVVDITERREAEEALKESEEKFRGIAESSHDAIFWLESDGRFSYVSPSAERISGYTVDEIVGKNIIDFVSESEKDKMNHLLPTLVKGRDIQKLQVEIDKKEGVPAFIEINASPIMRDDKVIGIQGIARDITERKREEDEMRKHLMKFKIKDGILYLVQESVPNMAIGAFNDLVKIGYKGVVISRTPKRDLNGILEGKYDYYWMTEKGKENVIPPKLNKIEKKLESMSQRNVVLLDRLDYLILKNGFKKTLLFIQRLRESAYLSGFVVIISVDPLTLKERELKLLEKETAELSPREAIPLSEDLSEIMRYVYQRNIAGTKPSYTEICRELSISKPTVRKRIRRLIRTGFLLQDIKGRSKVVELTEKGRSLFV